MGYRIVQAISCTCIPAYWAQGQTANQWLREYVQTHQMSHYIITQSFTTVL